MRSAPKFISALCVALSFAFTVAAHAAEKTPVYVKVLKMKPTKLKVGQATEIQIPFEVADGYHIQSNPASQPQLIATTLEVAATPGFQTEKPVYPPGKVYKLKSSPQELLTYDNKFEIKVPITATEATKAKAIDGSLRFQACNDTVCFFPTKINFSLPVAVSK